MKRAISVLLVIGACGALAGACSLNPQPLPPSGLNDQSNKGDAGNGNGGSGGLVLADGAASPTDATVDAFSEGASGAFSADASFGTDSSSEDASNRADTSSDALDEPDASGKTDALCDAPSDAPAPSDAAWHAESAGGE
jgi:hypothetical protein